MTSIMHKTLWVDPEQTVWEYERTDWEDCCRAPRDNREIQPGLPDDYCGFPTYYTGKRKEGGKISLCSDHFEPIKATCVPIRIEIG